MILAALSSLWGFAKLIPWWLYALIVAVVYHFAAIHVAVSDQKTEDDKAHAVQLATQKANADAVIAKVQAKQQEVITKTVTVYRDRIKVVKEKGDEIIKEVPVLVPMDSPLLSGGVRVLHDAAASGDMPGDPLGTAGVIAAVSAVAGAVQVFAFKHHVQGEDK